MAALNDYEFGQTVRLSVSLTVVATGVLTDPSALTFRVLHPDRETEDAYVYLTSAAVVRDSAGRFHLDILCDEAGVWVYRVETTGAAAGAGEKRFTVNHSRFPDDED